LSTFAELGLGDRDRDVGGGRLHHTTRLSFFAAAIEPEATLPGISEH
jgi:hypothetical protein